MWSKENRNRIRLWEVLVLDEVSSPAPAWHGHVGTLPGPPEGPPTAVRPGAAVAPCMCRVGAGRVAAAHLLKRPCLYCNGLAGWLGHILA